MTGSEAGGRRWSVGAMVSAALAARHDPAAQIRNVDLLAVLIALLLPWSTSGVAIASVLWLAALLWAFDPHAFLQFLKRPICIWPIALFVLAVIGTLWSEATWGERLQGIGPTLKLLMLPFLLHHFERSQRGHWVFVAFLVSCTLLMAMSWIVTLEPNLSLKSPDEGMARGIFVKNYIDQSQEFALCAVALAYPIVKLWREGKLWLAALLVAVVTGLFANMAFVIVSRTAMVTMPVMLAVVAVLHLKWRTSAMLFAAFAVLAGMAFVASPQLRKAVDSFASDYQRYRDSNAPTSMGLRLEFWRKSAHFISEAPLMGHGTGSTRMLFEQVAVGDTLTSASAHVIANPHNQTLGVAVQWGVLGVVMLWAMWISHLLLFRGEGVVAGIGLLVVVQNIFTSLFNSHIFDFNPGWLYVLGVGVAGGMVLRNGARDRDISDKAKR